MEKTNVSMNIQDNPYMSQVWEQAQDYIKEN